MKIPNSRCRSQTHFKDIAIFAICRWFFRVLKCIRVFSYDQNRGIPTAGTQHLKRWEYRSQDATPWTGRLLLQCYGGAIEKTTLTLRDASSRLLDIFSLTSALLPERRGINYYYKVQVQQALERGIKRSSNITLSIQYQYKIQIRYRVGHT